MFLRDLWDVSLNRGLINIFQRNISFSSMMLILQDMNHKWNTKIKHIKQGSTSNLDKRF